MAIGALLGEHHSFMHDLESFFWVLFWICIHCGGSGVGGVVAQSDNWNYADPEELAKLKLGTVSDIDIFRRTTVEFLTKLLQAVGALGEHPAESSIPRRWEVEEGGQRIVCSNVRDT